MEETQKNFQSKQYLFNLISNFSVYGINILIRIVLTPLIIAHFSLSQFGLFSAVSDFTNGMLSLASCFVLSSNRFITIAIRKGQDEKASRFFNTSLSMTLIIMTFALPIMIIFLSLYQRSASITDDLLPDFQLLFLLLSIQILFEILRIVLSSKLISENRIDLDNISIFTTRFLYFCSFLILILNQQISLIYLGLIILISSLIGLFIEIVFFLKQKPDIVVDLKIDKVLNQEILKLSQWLFIDSLGSTLFIRSGSIITSILLGSEVAGIYSAFFSIAFGLRILGQVFSNVSTPRLYQDYSKKLFKKLNRDLLEIIKFQGALLGFVIGIFCGFAQPLLRLWLGESFVQYSTILIIMISHLVFNLSIAPLSTIQVIYNKVKYPGIVNIITSILSILLSIVLITRFQLGILGIVVSEAICISLKNLTFTIFFNKKITNIKVGQIFQSMKYGLLGFAGVSLFSFYLSSLIQDQTLLQILFIVAVLGLIYFFIFIKYFFDNELMKDVIAIFKKPINFHHR